MTSEKLLQSIKNLPSKEIGDLDSSLGFIYREIDVCLSKREVDVVDYILKELNPETMDICLSLGMLTICLQANTYLSNYESFYNKCLKHYTQQEGEKRAKSLLKGLEKKFTALTTDANDIKTIEKNIKLRFPKVKATMFFPENPNGWWWLDVYFVKSLKDDLGHTKIQHKDIISIQWNAAKGFGLNYNNNDVGYGTNLDEIIKNVDDAETRIIEVLKEKENQTLDQYIKSLLPWKQEKLYIFFNTIPNAEPPIIDGKAYNHGLSLYWSYKDYFLEIIIKENNDAEWFYRNIEANDTAGEEFNLLDMPKILIDLIPKKC